MNSKDTPPYTFVKLLASYHFEDSNLLLLTISHLNKSFEVIHRVKNKTIEEDFFHLYKRLDTIYEMVTHGASAIIIVDDTPPSPPYYIYENEEVDLPIISDVSYTERTGDILEYKGPPVDTQIPADTSYRAILRPTVEGVQLNCLYRAPSLNEAKSNIVSGYIKPDSEQSGIILFTPYINYAFARTDNKHKATLNHFINLIPILTNKQTEKPKLPNWAYDFDLEKEAKLKIELSQKEIELQETQSQIKVIEDILEGSEWLKHLVTEDDTPLENAVRKVLNEMGLRTVNGPPKQADLISYDGSTLYALEVKGKKGALTPANVQQCERWITDIKTTFRLPENEREASYKEYAKILKSFGFKLPIGENDDLPCEIKGLLIGNTYKETTLLERPDIGSHTGEHFSTKMQTDMTSQKIAGVTTLQLLGMYSLHRNNPDKAKQALDRLLKTDGVFKELNDCKEFVVLESHEPQLKKLAS